MTALRRLPRPGPRQRLLLPPVLRRPSVFVEPVSVVTRLGPTAVPLPRKWDGLPFVGRGREGAARRVPQVGATTGFRKPCTARTSGTVLGAELVYARVSTAKQDLDRQVDALAAAGIPAQADLSGQEVRRHDRPAPEELSSLIDGHLSQNTDMPSWAQTSPALRPNGFRYNAGPAVPLTELSEPHGCVVHQRSLSPDRQRFSGTGRDRQCLVAVLSGRYVKTWVPAGPARPGVSASRPWQLRPAWTAGKSGRAFPGWFRMNGSLAAPVSAAAGELSAQD